ncbi:hypothetical protein [Peptoniphilus sp. HMSC062D09]|uniref:hypothetical protein n=1 Tax=Peptoniphilus sp. HMSC062D09 TaxID=1739305 RepID=UPI000A4C4690|nr:hypothetical protein [Peptoniphilus sp. HMSC062D09]
MEFIVFICFMILLLNFRANSRRKQFNKDKTYNNLNPIYLFFALFCLLIWLCFAIKFMGCLFDILRAGYEISISKFLFPQIRDMVLKFAENNNEDISHELLSLLMSYENLLKSCLLLIITFVFLDLMLKRIVIKDEEIIFNNRVYKIKDIVDFKNINIFGNKYVQLKLKKDEIYLPIKGNEKFIDLIDEKV